MREPDFVGPAGRAWKTNAGDAPAWQLDAWMGGYLIFAPGAHPLWRYHVVTGIHLRPHRDEPNPPHIDFPGATHEVLCMALSPDFDDQIDPDDSRTFHYLTPPDATVQVILRSDDQARNLVTVCARACVEGVLIPDSDWRSLWRDVLAKTAEHLRLGDHPPDP